MICPCRSEKPYDTCCGPYHAGGSVPTPLALMRSRYSAYALKKIDYILSTACTVGHREEVMNFMNEVSFDGLDIISVEGGYVTFRAHLSKDGKDLSFTEKSHFIKVKGTWKYHSGILYQS
jgi:SEC-C motif-containing protein